MEPTLHPARITPAMLDQPLHVYCNWSAYDELSDQVPLTEAVAMAQFEHLLRLREAGVRLDGYLMDCFWYEPSSAYRRFRSGRWGDNGERWLAACQRHGVIPGLWFASNNCGQFGGLEVAEAWRGSVDPAAHPRHAAACMFEGPFLGDLMAAFEMWYQRGVRIYKLDFCHLGACLPHHRLSLLPSEIAHLNAEAFRTALRTFRRTHPGAVVMAYNGFEEQSFIAGTDFEPRKTMDHRWLEAVDCFYAGDPRPADVPAMRFWRSKDIYSDHMVRAYLAQGFRPQVIDNAGFMIGTCGTCYHRGIEAWKGMLLLALARGGWLTTYYGNLDLLSDQDARWFARAHRLFAPLIAHGRWSALGAMPGAGAPYAHLLADESGALACAVNPGQLHATLALPPGPWRLLFSDGGNQPALTADGLRLGPEQMALLGRGRCADPGWDLGVQEDVQIPAAASALAVASVADGRNRARATVTAPAGAALRVVVRQRRGGRAHRTTGGAPPAGRRLGELLRIGATQAGKPLRVRIEYDHAIWSGLSWAVGEIEAAALAPGEPVTLEASSQDAQEVELEISATAVSGAPPPARA